VTDWSVLREASATTLASLSCLAMRREPRIPPGPVALVKVQRIEGLINLLPGRRTVVHKLTPNNVREMLGMLSAPEALATRLASRGASDTPRPTAPLCTTDDLSLRRRRTRSPAGLCCSLPGDRAGRFNQTTALP